MDPNHGNQWRKKWYKLNWGNIQQDPKNHPTTGRPNPNRHPTSGNRIPTNWIGSQKEENHGRKQSTNHRKTGLIQLITKYKSIWREGIKNLQGGYNISDETLTVNKKTHKKIMYNENRSKFKQYVKKRRVTESKVKHWLEIRGGEIHPKKSCIPKKDDKKTML